MRVAVLGATGAVGSAVVEALRFDPHKRVDAVLGIARRLPLDPQPNVDWQAVDLAGLAGAGPDARGSTELAAHLRGVDALVNAARARTTGPARGTGPDDVSLARHVLEVAAAAGVLHVVQLSSFLAYTPPPTPGAMVDETWPTDGLTQTPAGRRAVALERYLDEFAAAHEVTRLVRIRSGVVLGPRVRQQVLARTGMFSGFLRLLEHVPVVPGPATAGVPAVHHDDLAAAVRSAVTEPAFGAYNVALDEPLRPADVANGLGARSVTVPDALARRGAAFADRLFQRRPRGRDGAASSTLQLLACAPRLDTRRARAGLEWTPIHPLDQSLRSTLAAS